GECESRGRPRLCPFHWADAEHADPVARYASCSRARAHSLKDSIVNASYLPIMSRAGLAPTHAVAATDEYGARRDLHIAGERPLTHYVDKKEIVTLMTLGTQPEALALGYLRNQGLIERLEDIKAVQADWDTESVVVTTHGGV